MQTYKVIKPIHFNDKWRKPGEVLELHPTNALTLAFLHFKQIEPVTATAAPEKAVAAPVEKADAIPLEQPALEQPEKPFNPLRVPNTKAQASQVIAEFKTKFRGK